MTAISDAERKRQERARQRAKGWVPIEIWVKPENKERAKKAAKRWQ